MSTPAPESSGQIMASVLTADDPPIVRYVLEASRDLSVRPREGGAVERDDGAGGITAGEFGAAFKGFLEQAAAQAPIEDPFFARRLSELFGREPNAFPVVSPGLPVPDHPNVPRSP